jgi:hypothetical protein
MTMRRWATWLLLGALAALALVAVADALRGNRSTTLSHSLPPSSEEKRAAIETGGVIFYSDEADDCRLAASEFPSLESGPPPKLRSCRFSVSPDGTMAFPGDVTWSPDGARSSREVGNLLEVTSTESQQVICFPGSAPAFKPDGTLT